jgi:protein phosphatase 2C family protein 2/3
MKSVISRMMREFELLDEFDASKGGMEEEAAAEDLEEDEEEEEGEDVSAPIEAVLISPRPAPGFLNQQASSVGFQLPTMDRSNRSLTRVPSEVWQRSWLTRLSLSRNSITVLDGNRLAQQLPNLTILDLSYNSLSSLELQSNLLKELRLNGCPLESLELQCGRLELLLLDGCRLKSLDSLAGLSGLATLSLAGAKIRETLVLPNSLTRLDVSNNVHLTALPDLPPCLVSLSCADNPQIKQLLGLPSSLESCFAARCGLEKVDLHGAVALRDLDVSWNLLTSFEASAELRRLNLSHNANLGTVQLSTLLEELNVDHCNFSSFDFLPDSLVKFRSSCCFELKRIAMLPPKLSFFSCCFCPLLETLPDIPVSLSTFWVAHCPKLQLRIPDALIELTNLFISRSPGVVPPVKLPASLSVLRATHCPHLLDLTVASELEVVDVSNSMRGVGPASDWAEACREVQSSADWLQARNAHIWNGPASRTGAASTVGDRPSYEDAWGWNDRGMAVLCDGHAGKESADLACSALLESVSEDLEAAIRAADERVKSGLPASARHSGSTVVVAQMTESLLAIANVGDARAVLVSADKAVRRLSVDHKPEKEEDRIRKAGGWVENGRVNGVLGESVFLFVFFVYFLKGVSRAVGDFYLRPAVVCEPFVSSSISLPGECRLLLGCDGVFDEMPDDLAGILVMSGGDCQEAAERVRDAAIALGSSDNISAIVISL